METILVVDDTKTNIKILIELLGDNYDVIAALNGEMALEMIEEEEVDLILLDIMMPQMDGFEVCRRLKSEPKTKDIPIIFLTAMSDEQSIEKAYDLGGSDYVTKPFRPKELLARVKRELQLVTLQNELKLLASTDPMTKLYNRRYFTKVSEHILDLAQRKEEPLSVLMLDIDKFKSINDSYGHAIGDDVIIKLSEILKAYQRKSDIVCRYGGEEFVILLPNTNIDGATVVANKIREVVEQNRVLLDTKEVLKFTVSLGVSQVDLENEKDMEKALNNADGALYEAKKNGRNMVVKYC
ncbi:MAG: diguanylate cyclase [Campylobacterota bacterium]|nr:diguanylate cyclase [Campylobacterota bacterium]